MRTWIILAAALGLISIPCLGATLEDIQLVRSDASGVEAIVNLPEPVVRPAVGYPGYHTISLGSIPTYGEPGEPLLPRVGFWIAVPPGATARVTTNGSDELVWDRIRPLPAGRPEWIGRGADDLPVSRETVEEDPAIYSGPLFPSSIASLSPPSMMRHMRVVSVVVSPARWDPGSGELVVARSVRVRVEWDPSPAPVEGRPLGRVDPSWERMYESTVINADAGMQMARRPLARAQRARIADTTELVKFDVMTSGLRKVTFTDLDQVGWRGGGFPLSEMRLFESFHDSDDAADPPREEVDVPILIIDADESETWSPGDALYFYGQNVYERLPDAHQYLLRYGRRHVYWLGLRSSETNARMDEASSWLGQTLTPVGSYPWTEHFEDEVDAYGKSGAGAGSNRIDDESNIRAGVSAVRSKHFYWQGGDPLSQYGGWYSVKFDLPGYLAPRGLTVRLQGIRRAGGSSLSHSVDLYLSREAERDTVRLPDTPVVFPREDSIRYVADAGSLEGMPLRENDNYLVHLSRSRGEGVGLHWFEVEYDREPRFVDGICQVGTGDLSGATSYALERTPSEEIVAVEFTDPRAPRALSIDPATQITQVGPNRILTVQWELDGSERLFWFGDTEQIPGPDLITLDTPSDLAAPGSHDYVAIVPREWIPTLTPLLDHRRSTDGGGHDVLVAAIEDVYDEFSGGRRWSHAIRSFLRTLFRTRDVPPSFLLLVGDGTNAFDNDIVNSDENWMPTITQFSAAFDGYYGHELVTSDQWFVDDLVGTGEILDYMPDMHIGRLPASDPAELTAMIDKILAYEDFSEGEQWRNRALLVSDDAYSGQLALTDAYRYRSNEEIFRRAGRSARDIIQIDGNLVDFDVDSFWVACYMDTVPSLGRCQVNQGTGRCDCCVPCMDGCVIDECRIHGEIDYEVNFRYGEDVVAPRLTQTMSRGYLFVSFNGHSNARMMTHEHVFMHLPFGAQDVDRLTNSGRPFVFMGYGCHLCEFSAANEGAANKQDGICETLLTTPGIGGVAAIASTAYEWLPHTDAYNDAVCQALFKNPPQYEEHTRWVVGEVLTRSKANIISRNSETFSSMAVTYMLLGDPGLIMDAAPPRMQVAFNGEEITDGAILTMPADSDSVLFEAQVRDEVWAKSFAIEDVYGVVPQDRYTVLPDSTDDRSFAVTYTTTILPRTYQIIMSAEDANGRISRATYSVNLDVQFELRHEGGDWVELAGGETVVAGDSIRAIVQAPRHIPVADLELLLDGEPMLVRGQPIGSLHEETAAGWVLTTLEEIGKRQSRTLMLRVRQPDGGAVEFTRVIETAESYDIETVYNVPNPFKTETWIFYILGATADDVQIKIYTTSGKQIRTLRGLPGLPGLNEAHWDGKDEDGDTVANGLYFYKLFVKNAQGQVTRIEKLAKVK